MQKSRLRAAILNAADRNAALVIKNAKIVNVFTEEILEGDVAIRDGIIIGVGSYSGKAEIDAKGGYLCPGLIDGHVHIESSMAHPSRFANVILEKGTTSIIADPHEIANVCGSDGIQYMLDQTEWLPLSVFIMVPSCVPATAFETSGAKLTARDLEAFIDHPRVLGLGEVMDYVATVEGDGEMLDKLHLFRHHPIDGHAPALTGDALNAYCVAGPHTDHECLTYEEVLEKLRNGMRIHLRLGSANRGVEEIMKKIAENGLPTRRMSFCTDDKHLADIRAEGHINYIVRRAVANGISPIHAIQMATINTANTYGIRHYGAVAPGYRADLVLFDNLTDFNPQFVITDGKLFEPSVDSHIKPDPKIYNSVHLAPRKPDVLRLPVSGKARILRLIPKELVTTLDEEEVYTEDGCFVPKNGLLKLAVVERHHASGRVGLGILRGFDIQNGAIATTVGHDSHNLIVVGDNDADMLAAIDALEECGGGYVVVRNGEVLAKLVLSVAGLMSDAPLETILKHQHELLDAAATLGIHTDSDPFITLSFIALPVIPAVRLTDMGLFDVTKMEFFEKHNQ
ncbi:MAG TPA: adenine deaminase [Eubacteriales bacterium]|nr:adenine deaminase [Eubacteriales bacterium]